jgi:aspartate kinase
MLKVVKFGGSSMADGHQFEKVKAIVEADPARRVVVVSAAGKRFADDHKVTDLLYLCHAHMKYGVSCESVFSIIRQRYIGIRDELHLTTPMEDILNALWQKMNQGISQDELVSRGEYLAARLMADYLGFDFLDAELWLKFKFDGTVDQDATYEALRHAAEGHRVVIPGFYGAMPDGSVKTFTRGGSDITGALAAAALEADVYENWTDVSGILMADPKIVDHPQPIERVTYSELRELSYVGAQVLHEGTIFPVREKNIPLNIRNTNDPDAPGTMIMETFEEVEEAEHRFITGIAGRKNYSILTITRTGMSTEVGVLHKILGIIDQYGISVDYLPSGIDNVSLVMASDKIAVCQYAMIADIQKAIRPDSIKIIENIAIVAAVGRKMAFKPGISGRIFATLGENKINIRMISQGPEELNIIVGVDNKDFARAIQVLYNSFVK